MNQAMQVSVEITGSLGRRVNVSVPAERVEQAVKERLQQIAKTAKIDGFRPGKMPLSAAEKMFGVAARGEATEKLIQTTLFEALKQEDLRPAGFPMIESLRADAGKPLEYTAAFDVFPEVQLQKLNNFSLEKLVVDITDADVDRVLQQMRNQHATWEIVQRPAEWGDRVTFDLMRSANEQQSTQDEQKDITLILEQDNIPAGFAAVKGATAGSEIQLTLNPGVKDSEVQAVAKIHKVEVANLPEINAEFAKLLGVSEGGVDALRKQVHQHMQDELDQVLKNKLKTQVVEKFLENHQLELPKALLEEEFHLLEKDLKERMTKELGRQSESPLPESTKENLMATARQRVTLGILYPAFIKQHDIKVDEARVRAHIDRIARAFEGAQAMIDLVYKDKNIMNSIRSQVLEEQILEKLLEQVQFNEKIANYSDVMNLRSASLSHHGHVHPDDHVHDEHCNHDH